MEVEFKDVNYVANNKQILRNVTLKLKDGKINGFIGPNGGGKTTIIKILNGLIYQTSGEVKIDQFNIESNDNDCLYLDIGSLGQHPEDYFFCENVQKELEFSLESYNYKKEKINKHIKDALKMVGLKESYLKCDPLKLSSSEMRKVLLAKSLAVNPKILILDEPTIGLDMDDKKRLSKILKTIKRRYNKTIVIVSHDIEFIHQVVDHIFVFNHGQLIVEGDKYEVFKQDKLLRKNGILIPRIIEFELLVSKGKNINLGYRDEINDLIKDILRNA